MTSTDDPLGHRWTAVRVYLHDELRAIFDELATVRGASAYADCARRSRGVLTALAEGSTDLAEWPSVEHECFGAAIEAISARRLPADDLGARRRLVRSAFEHAWAYTVGLDQREVVSRRDVQAALVAASQAVALVELELSAVLQGGRDECPNCGSPNLAPGAEPPDVICRDCGWHA